MACLIKRSSTRKGWVYYIRYRINGKIREISTRTKARTIANHVKNQYDDLEIKNKLGIEIQKKPLRLSELHERRIKWLENNDKSPHTIEREATAYKFFTRFLGNDPTNTPTLEIFDSYKEFRKGTGASASTINGDIRCLQTLYNWGKERSYCDPIAIPKISQIKIPKKRPVYLEEDEIERFFKAIDTIPPPKSNSKFRDEEDCREYWRLIFEIYFTTGGRKSEVASLKWKDVDSNAGEIIFRASTTKDLEDRRVPIPEGLLAKLEKHRRDNEDFIIPYDGSWVYRLYKRYALAAGITEKGKLELHATRRTCASHLAKKGVSLFLIMKILGHSDIKTTMIYVELAPNDSREAINKLPWVSK